MHCTIKLVIFLTLAVSGNQDNLPEGISGDAVSVNLEIKERVEAQLPQCIPGVAVPVDQESIKAI